MNGQTCVLSMLEKFEQMWDSCRTLHSVIEEYLHYYFKLSPSCFCNLEKSKGLILFGFSSEQIAPLSFKWIETKGRGGGGSCLTPRWGSDPRDYPAINITLLRPFSSCIQNKFRGSVLDKHFKGNSQNSWVFCRDRVKRK